jgi:hypothetical protein
MAVLFCLYIAFAMLAVLNVVTGVFVESALLTAKADRDAELLNQLRRVFSVAAPIPGVKVEEVILTWYDFVEILEYDTSHLQALGIDPAEARGLFLLLDTDGAGEIDGEEFVQEIVRLRGPTRAIDLETLMYFNKRMSTWWREQMRDVQAGIEEVFHAIEDLHDDVDVHVRTSQGSRQAMPADANRDSSGRDNTNDVSNLPVVHLSLADTKVAAPVDPDSPGMRSPRGGGGVRLSSFRSMAQTTSILATWSDFKAEGARQTKTDFKPKVWRPTNHGSGVSPPLVASRQGSAEAAGSAPELAQMLDSAMGRDASSNESQASDRSDAAPP